MELLKTILVEKQEKLTLVGSKKKLILSGGCGGTTVIETFSSPYS